MVIDSFLQRGIMHKDHNEDALFFKHLDETWVIAAVMDGCSTGKDSYFASALYVKSIKKSCLTTPQLNTMNDMVKMDDLDCQMLGKVILKHLFEDQKNIRQSFLLEKSELLSTLLLLVLNKKTKEAFINISGDGFFAVNEKVTEVIQNNMPDFMGYHMDIEFDDWLENHSESHNFYDVESIVIATDGITKLFNKKKGNYVGYEPVKIFLSKEAYKNQLMIEDKFNLYTSEKNLLPYDDIAIVQVTSKSN